MSSSAYHSPELPWSSGQDSSRLKAILAVLMAIVFIVGVVVPYVELPEPERQTLTELPPQLAKIIERKQKELPKPEITVEEPEPLPEEEEKPPEPEEKPEPEPAPKPQRQPEQEKKVEATVEQREVARQKARDVLGGEALQALSGLRNQIPVAALGTSSGSLLGNSSTATQAVVAGDVVDRANISAGSEGVDVAAFTTDDVLVGESLEEREITQVTEIKSEDIAPRVVRRSQGEIRVVFENTRVDYDRIYRSALRKDPTLSGEVSLSLTIQPNGSVSSCEVESSEIQDNGLLRRVLSKCRQMNFGDKPNVEVAKVVYPIRFSP